MSRGDTDGGGANGQREHTGPFAFLRRLDDALFSVEQTIVVTFLGAMTAMVFLDVVDRRLTAPDSKIGDLLGRLFGVDGGDTKTMLDQTVAPIVGALLGLGLLWFAFASARRHAEGEAKKRAEAGEKAEEKRRLHPLVSALLLAGLLAGLGYLMTWREEVEDEWGAMVEARVFPSKYFYLLLFLLAVVPWSLQLLRDKPEGWWKRIAGFVVAGGLLAYFALTFFPDGYSWSLEVAGIMLLWVGSLGASVCVHAGKHIRIEALQKAVPEKLRPFVTGAGFFAAAAYSGFLGYLGTDYLKFQIDVEAVFAQTSIPDWVATLAIPLAFYLTAARFFGAGVSALMGGRYGLADVDEVAVAAAAREEVPEAEEEAAAQAGAEDGDAAVERVAASGGAASGDADAASSEAGAAEGDGDGDDAEDDDDGAADGDDAEDDDAGGDDAGGDDAGGDDAGGDDAEEDDAEEGDDAGSESGESDSAEPRRPEGTGKGRGTGTGSGSGSEGES